MLKLSLEAIELVDTIARHGSFAGAAERLHKVPSTISYAVSKLEEQLGLNLFVRNGPRVSSNLGCARSPRDSRPRCAWCMTR